MACIPVQNGTYSGPEKPDGESPAAGPNTACGPERLSGSDAVVAIEAPAGRPDDRANTLKRGRVPACFVMQAEQLRIAPRWNAEPIHPPARPQGIGGVTPRDPNVEEDSMRKIISAAVAAAVTL